MSVAGVVAMMFLPLAVLVTLSGCLLPPDAEYVEPPANQPPRIEAPSPWPSLDITDHLTGCGSCEVGKCAAVQYQATVVDPDGDSVYWRTFVDYHLNQRQEFGSGQAFMQPTGVPVTFYVEHADKEPRFGSVSEPHLVELLVADRPFDPDDRFSRDVSDGGDAASIIWTVQLRGYVPPCE